MAGASIIFLFLAAAVIILGILLITGLIFLITGIVKHRRPENKGKKYPKVFMVTGIILLLLPVGTSACLLISSITSSVSTNIKRAGYENITDKWRSEHVTDNAAARGAIDELLSCADSGDRERFAKTFTPNIQRSTFFDKHLDEFFAEYPAGLNDCELDGGRVASSGSFRNGHNVQTGSTYYTCRLNGEWYKIVLAFCYENTDSPDDVGVTFFSVENLGGAALDKDYYKPMVCCIKSESEVSARLINGTAFLFEPTPDRIITEDDMKRFLKTYKTLKSLSDVIGKPNVSKKYDNCTGYDYYYELVPENGEPRYVYICTERNNGRIITATVCSETDFLYDKEIFIKE